MSNRRKMTDPIPDPEARRAQSLELIDKILYGTPEGKVDPAISENLRQHMAANPEEPDRALLNHFRDQIPGFDGVFPEDLK